MANTTFLDLPVAVTLDGTEVVPIVQPPTAQDGVSKRATTLQIASLALQLGNFTGTLTVPFGGTGATAFSANAVLLGNNTAALSVVAPATSSYVLTSNGTGSPPTWQPASSGGLSSQPGLSVLGVAGNATATPAAIVGTASQVLVVNSAGTGLLFGSVDVSSLVTGILPVGFGGTGTSALTAHGLVLGNGTASAKIIAAVAAARLLISQGTNANPSFNAMSGDATIASGGAVTIAAHAVTYAKFQQPAALSVVANSSSAAADAVSLAGTHDQVLIVNPAGTALLFGQLNLSATAAVTGVLPLATNVTGVLPIANGGTNASTAATAIVNLSGLSLLTTGQVFSGGIILSTLNLGTAAGNTTVLVAGNNPTRSIVVNGTATFVAPSSDCEFDLLVVNAASASTISFSGYSVGSNTGDTYATTSGSKFLFMSRTINGSSTYAWKAFQ